MATATMTEPMTLGVRTEPHEPPAPPITLSERAAAEVKRAIVDYQASETTTE